jgi:phosphoribosylformimino-5-aminoimidazole carboxamide ribotide isomerase
MELIPSIDLRAGGVVRLLRGNFEQETRYSVDPLELAAEYRRLGARWLHVVDLDGAANGEPAHLDLVSRIRERSGLRVQFGGGIRNRSSLTAALAAAGRVVVGSLAVSEPERVAGWLSEVGPERLALAMDVRVDAAGEPLLTTHGWRQSTSLSLWQALEPYRGDGLRHVLCTDVDRDGALQGPNLELYQQCVSRWPQLAWQASGGVRDAADLRAVAEEGVAGAISGKALLEGRLDPREIRSFLPNA